MTDSLRERITINGDILAGKPAVRGLRISVEQILRALAVGVPQDDLLADYPELEQEDILAVLTYAADLVSETKIYPVAA